MTGSAPAARKPPLFHGRTGLVAALRGRVKRLMGEVPHDPRVASLTRQLQTLGFTRVALDDLATLARDARDRHTRTSAAIELAKWYIRPQALQDHRQALDWIAVARTSVRLKPQRRHLVVLELLCLNALGEVARGQQVYADAVAAGLWTPDLALAGTMVAPDPDARIGLINTALAPFGIAPIGLRDAPDLPPYDRLVCTGALQARHDGPKVSVILAAYEADETLRTALGALQAQTWQNLEILVVDDASPSGSTARIVGPFAAADPRIRLIGMPVNGGAYMARNRALDLAGGDYVTLHDADDWSHPQKIETQLAHLQANPAVLGCASEQARATNDLDFLRWTGDGRAIMTNYSSFMFRRAEMHRHFGYWDTVRMSADNELIRRMRAKFGHRAVRFMTTGPLSFQRDAQGTMTSDPVLGINGFRYGARQEYLEAFTLWHRDRDRLRYTGRPDDRPFPAPGIMQPDRDRVAAEENRFDMIVATDFRASADHAQDALDDIAAFREAGLRVAAFALHRYLGPSRHPLRMEIEDDTRLALWARQVRILCHGETVQCRRLLIHDPACIAQSRRYLPTVRADRIGLVAHATAGTPETGMLWSAATTLRDAFGADALWYPRDAAARQALQVQVQAAGAASASGASGAAPAIVLSAQDWADARLTFPDDAGPHAAASLLSGGT